MASNITRSNDMGRLMEAFDISKKDMNVIENGKKKQKKTVTVRLTEEDIEYLKLKAVMCKDKPLNERNVSCIIADLIEKDRNENK